MFCAFSPVPCHTDLVVSNNNFPENKRSQRRSKDSRKDVSFYVFVDTASEVELPVSVHEETHSKISSSKRNEEDSEFWEDPEGPAVADTDGSVEGALLGSQLVSQQGKKWLSVPVHRLKEKVDSEMTEHMVICFISKPTEHDAEFQILKYLLQIDVFGFMNSAFSTIEILIERVSQI